MRPIFKSAGAVTVFLMLLVADLPNLSGRLVPEAQALRGRGAAFAVGAAVGSSKASGAEAEAAAAQQQAAAANQQAAAAQQQAATAQAQLAAEKEKTAAAQQQAALAQQQAAVAGAPLPVGTVVSALPPGCVATPVGGVNYQYCGGNFYEPKYQGSTLVYVTAKPK
jgi:nucleoid-associated protein YgaU